MRHRAIAFLRRLERIIQPSGVGLTMRDRTLVAKTILASSGLAFVSTLVLIPTFFIFDEALAGWLSVLSLCVYAAALGLFLSTGSVERTAKLAIALGLASVFAIHWVLGGYQWSGGFVLWGIANTVFAALWLGRRETFALMWVYGTGALALVVLDPYVQSLRSPPDPWIARIVMADIMLVTILLTAPAILAMVGRIRSEQARARSLLLNLLPASIADRLQDSDGWIAERYDDCTVLFADLVGFTAHTHEAAPGQILGELNVVFSKFDSLTTRHGGEKIKTIGDGYMVAFGAPEPLPAHTAAACRLAMEMVDSLAEINAMIDSSFEIRIGISAGPLIGGVIGTKKFSYDLWGVDVNLASRLERAARPGSILVSERVASTAGPGFEFEPRGLIELKGMPSTAAFELTRIHGAEQAGAEPVDSQ